MFYFSQQVNVKDVDLLFDWLLEQDNAMQSKPKFFDSNTIQPEIKKAKVWL